MKRNLSALMQEAMTSKLNGKLASVIEELGFGEVNDESRKAALNHLADLEEFVYAQFTGRDFSGKEVSGIPELGFNEALNTSDVSIVFPRVISTILQEPVEPNLFLQNSVAEVITLPDSAPLLIEFPSVGTLQAYDMAEGQEYTLQTAGFTQNQTSIRIGKIGVAAALTEEVRRHSMWNLVDLHLRMMRRAIDRQKESHLFKAMTSKARVVFDNNVNDTEFHTTGKRVAGAAAVNNGSFSYSDLVKLCGTILQSQYTPTHFLAHPLTWPIFAQDPILRAQFYHGGQLGAGIWTRMPQYDQQASFPFGISYVPYFALPYRENASLTATGAPSTGVTPVISDLYLIDQANSLFMATRGQVEFDNMEDWFRDASMMKTRQYVGFSVKDQGRGMAAARNVRIVPNEEPLFTVRQVTS